MTPPPPSKRLRRLVDRHLDGSLTRLEMAEFEEHLREPEALDYYLAAVEIDAGLRQLAADEKLADADSALAVEMPSDGRPLLLASAAAVVALLVAGAVALAVLNSEREPASPTVAAPVPVEAARVVRQIGTESPGQRILVLRAGETFVAQAGLTDLVFKSGARILLEGPAELRVTDADSARLEHGRCVVSVPAAPKRGFYLSTRHGDAKTMGSRAEFAVAVTPEGDAMDVGVLEGVVSASNQESCVVPSLGRRDGVRIARGAGPQTISFPFESFHRSFPSRELAWQAPADSFEPVVMEHDLSGLIWEPGHYRVYFKWMHGSDALRIHSAELLRDGQPVAADVHEGVAGDPYHTRRHAYHFDIAANDYQPGAWTLRTVVQTNPRHLGEVQLPDDIVNPRGVILLADDPLLAAARESARRSVTARPNSHGVLLVEQGHAAEPYEFCHTWEYVHNGLTYRRTFFENGTARLERDGELLDNFDRATWRVEDGVLTLEICHPDTDDFQCVERHLLRDADTLIFLDRPYRNATRLRPQ